MTEFDSHSSKYQIFGYHVTSITKIICAIEIFTTLASCLLFFPSLLASSILLVPIFITLIIALKKSSSKWLIPFICYHGLLIGAIIYTIIDMVRKNIYGFGKNADENTLVITTIQLFIEVGILAALLRCYDYLCELQKFNQEKPLVLA